MTESARSYIVLKLEESSEGISYKTVGSVDAASADVAKRRLVKESGRYVAIPLRSFQPTDVTVETTMTVKIG